MPYPPGYRPPGPPPKDYGGFDPNAPASGSMLGAGDNYAGMKGYDGGGGGFGGGYQPQGGYGAPQGGYGGGFGGGGQMNLPQPPQQGRNWDDSAQADDGYRQHSQPNRTEGDDDVGIGGFEGGQIPGSRGGSGWGLGGPAQDDGSGYQQNRQQFGPPPNTNPGGGGGFGPVGVGGGSGFGPQGVHENSPEEQDQAMSQAREARSRASRGRRTPGGSGSPPSRDRQFPQNTRRPSMERGGGGFAGAYGSGGGGRMTLPRPPIGY